MLPFSSEVDSPCETSMASVVLAFSVIIPFVEVEEDPVMFTMKSYELWGAMVIRPDQFTWVFEGALHELAGSIPVADANNASVLLMFTEVTLTEYESGLKIVNPHVPGKFLPIGLGTLT